LNCALNFKRNKPRKKKKRRKILCDSWHSKCAKREQVYDLVVEELLPLVKTTMMQRSVTT
jgi:hypothetical protein